VLEKAGLSPGYFVEILNAMDGEAQVTENTEPTYYELGQSAPPLAMVLT